MRPSVDVDASSEYFFSFSHDECTRRRKPAGSVLVVTHIDVTGQGAPKVREMLRTLSDTSRKESGNLRFDALQGVRQNHFTVLEGWRDERAREAHVSSGHTKTFREGLYGFAVDGAPYDERLYRVLGP